jgi:hypothetical protein
MLPSAGLAILLLIEGAFSQDTASMKTNLLTANQKTVLEEATHRLNRPAPLIIIPPQNSVTGASKLEARMTWMKTVLNRTGPTSFNQIKEMFTPE